MHTFETKIAPLPPPSTEQFTVELQPSKYKNDPWASQDFELDSHNQFQPMETVEVEGLNAPISPFLKITVDTEPDTENYVAKVEKDGEIQISVVRVNKQEETRKLISTTPLKGWEGIPITEDGILLVSSRDNNGKSKLHVECPSESVGTKVTFEASAATSARLTSRERRHKASDRMKTARWLGKKALATVVVYGVLASGGLIDKSLDANSDAKKFVTTTFTPEGEPPITEYDGIPLADYPDHGAEFIKQQEDYNAAYAKAVESVAQTMSDLDSHSYGRIKERADQFMQERNDFIFDDDFIKIEEELGKAETVDELISLANKRFADAGFQYTRAEEKVGLNFEPLNNNVNVDDVRRNILESASILSIFPKQFVEEELNKPTIVLASLETLTQVVGASSDGSNISLPVQSKIVEAAREGIQILDTKVIGGGNNIKWYVAHEAGHNYHGVSSFRDDTDKGYGPSMILYNLIQRPVEVSSYADNNGRQEQEAERFAALVSGESNGLAHPDETRRFESPLNKELIQLLIDLERDYPGLADRIVSKQSRLMGRGYLEVGR